MNKIKVKEIFASIQGEGPYVGYKQLFVRFCNCNLKCNYCDTEFSANENFEEFCPEKLAQKVNEYKDVHSVSLTGGEPLLHTEFLKDFLPRVDKKIYLETNATLADKFLEIKSFVDIVSADIKLESATGIKDTIKFHDKFFEACKGVETFAKIVFNKNITDTEIADCCELGKKYGIELILQPEMLVCHCEDEQSEDVALYQYPASYGSQVRLRCKPIAKSLNDEITTQTEFARNDNVMSVTSEFCSETLDKFLKNYEKVRLIPQVHKFLDVR